MEDYPMYVDRINDDVKYMDDQSGYSICNSVFDDKDSNRHLYKPCLEAPKDTFKVVFRFCINNNELCDYAFLNNVPPNYYAEIRYHLVLISCLSITEEENLAVVEFETYCRVISIAVLYWHKVVSKYVDGIKENPLILRIVPNKLRLSEIHIYSGDSCIERIPVSC
jgi:hypothetical protein